MLGWVYVPHQPEENPMTATKIEEPSVSVVVRWSAFAERQQSPVRETPVLRVEGNPATPLETCERVYKETNLYQGHLWDVIQANLPAERTHTALSVGDEVVVDGVTFLCQSAGFSEKEAR
jgi:hypothetical protein